MDQTFIMPSFRYTGDIPESSKEVFDPTSITSMAATNSNGGELRYAGGGKGRTDILEITTSDPDAKLFIGSFWIGTFRVTTEIPLPPGTYRFLSGIMLHSILILHSTYPDYKYKRYVIDNLHRGKLRQIQIYTYIEGKDYCYYNGNLNLAESFIETETIIPKQIPEPDPKGAQKCCPTCKQTIPLESPRTKRRREEKNRRRLPENYPLYFKRKIQELVDSGLIRRNLE